MTRHRFLLTCVGLLLPVSGVWSVPTATEAPASPRYLGPAAPVERLPQGLRQRLGARVPMTLPCGSVEAGPEAAASAYFLEGFGAFATVSSLGAGGTTAELTLQPAAEGTLKWEDSAGKGLSGPPEERPGVYRVRVGKEPVVVTGLGRASALRVLAARAQHDLAALEARRAKQGLPALPGSLKTGTGVLALTAGSPSAALFVDLAARDLVAWMDRAALAKPGSEEVAVEAYGLLSALLDAWVVLRASEASARLAPRETADLRWQATHWLDEAEQAAGDRTAGPRAHQWLQRAKGALSSSATAERLKLPFTQARALRLAHAAAVLSVGCAGSPPAAAPAAAKDGAAVR